MKKSCSESLKSDMKVYFPWSDDKQKRSTAGCSKFKSPETRKVQERLVSTLEHMQVPKFDRTRCPGEKASSVDILSGRTFVYYAFTMQKS